MTINNGVQRTASDDDDARAIGALFEGPAQRDAVLLVSMPWRVADCPNLALGVLAQVLSDAGMPVRVFEAALVASAMLPPPLYSALGRDVSGELAFAPYAYEGFDPETARRQLYEAYGNVGTEREPIDPAVAVDFAAACLERIFRAIAWERFAVVGFSLTFEQTLGSAALARRIKRAFPHIAVVIGGACCDGPMGAALLEEFDCFDFAVSGRAEATAVDVMRAALGHGSPAAVPGLAYRGEDGAVVVNPQEEMRRPLDELPIPVYDDYFALRRTLGLGHQGLRLLLETSVGCWWGEKHLCSFCGLNATSLSYRQKSSARVLREVRALSDRYRVDSFELTDNILPLSFFNDLLPALAQEDRSFTFFAEVKTNIKKEQLDLLRAAGFRCLQPGIESFDDHILELMDKGCTGIGQVQFIKWCHELGVDVGYSILVGNVGETVEDYERMLEWIPSLVHLPPPYSAPVRIQLARFSPYFEKPGAYGIRDVTPTLTFRRVFPRAPEGRLARMTYFFDFRADGLDAPELVAARERLARAVLRWRAVHAGNLLFYRRGVDWVRITDKRASALEPGRPIRKLMLRGAQAQVFLFCDRTRTFEQIAAHFPQIEKAALRAFLDDLVRMRVLLDDGNKLIALPVDARQAVSNAAQEFERRPSERRERAGEAELIARLGWLDHTPPPARRERRRLSVLTPREPHARQDVPSESVRT
jgi:ribosomal peptide maturation radical SAM protein 1